MVHLKDTAGNLGVQSAWQKDASRFSSLALILNHLCGSRCRTRNMSRLLSLASGKKKVKLVFKMYAEAASNYKNSVITPGQSLQMQATMQPLQMQVRG
jgi:hypothetical protein